MYGSAIVTEILSVETEVLIAWTTFSRNMLRSLKPIVYYLFHTRKHHFLVPHNPPGMIPAKQEPVLTGREVGGDSATHERPTGGIHGDGIVGTRKQVNKLEFFVDSIHQDGLSSNWNQIHADKERPTISKGTSHGLSTQGFWGKPQVMELIAPYKDPLPSFCFCFLFFRKSVLYMEAESCLYLLLRPLQWSKKSPCLSVCSLFPIKCSLLYSEKI